MGSKSKSSTSSTSQNTSYADYSTLDNSVTESNWDYASEIDSSYTDNSTVDLVDNTNNSESYSSSIDNSYRDLSSVNMLDRSNNSKSESYSSSIDNSYRDLSSVNMLDTSNNSTSESYSSSIDNSWADSSTVDLVDKSVNNSRTKTDIDASEHYSSQIDNSWRDQSSVSMLDSSNSGNSESYSSQIDNSFATSDYWSNTEAWSESYSSNMDNSVTEDIDISDSRQYTVTDGGAIDAMRDVVVEGFAWGESLTGTALDRMENLALKSIGTISDGSYAFLDRMADTLEDTSDKILWAADGVAARSESAFGEALLQSRDAFGNALSFAGMQNASDAQMIQGAADKNAKMLVMLAAVALLVPVLG